MIETEPDGRNELLKRWTEALFRDSPDMVFVKNMDLVYVGASQSFADMLGLPGPADIVGRTDGELFEDKALALRYVEDDRRMIAEGRPLAPYVEPLPRKNGKNAWGNTRKGLVRDGDGAIIGVYGVCMDITERVELELSRNSLEAENRKIRSAMSELKIEASTDALTKLLNHGASIDSMRDYLSGAGADGCHALMCIDLDNFKSVNDQLGHQRGDEVLARISASIASAFRTTDIIGRIGGDEFLVLMKDISSMAIVRSKAAEVIAAAQIRLRREDIHIIVSASVGVSLYEGSGESFEELFTEADAALSGAKAMGKNRFFIWKDEDGSQDAADMEEQPETEIPVSGVEQTELLSR